MTDVNNAAESSAVAAVAAPEFNPADQYTWSDEQRAQWNETGEVPEPKTQESAPAATPAKEAKSEPEGKTSAESETAPKQGKRERRPGEKLNADERIAQLTAKNRELERDLQAERERSRAPEPKSAASQPETAKQTEAPKRPNPFKWTGTAEEFEAAQEAWENHQKALAVQEFQRNEAQRAHTQKMQTQLEEVRAKYPDADAKLTATLESFSKVQFPGVIRGMLDDSECFPELVYVLSDETTRNNFIETAKTNPGKAIRVLAQMERDIEAARTAPGRTETARTESAVPAEPKPRAPKPHSEVGGRGAAPEDALKTAAEANDFRGFAAEMSRRKFARSA